MEHEAGTLRFISSITSLSAKTEAEDKRKPLVMVAKRRISDNQ
jgi:hypothetical protein